jgi:hypothetical protein
VPERVPPTRSAGGGALACAVVHVEGGVCKAGGASRGGCTRSVLGSLAGVLPE